MNPHETGVVILAAGISERMKTLKALLPFDEHNTFIGKIISTYHNWGCIEIVVVTNEKSVELFKRSVPEIRNVGLVINDHLEFERFYSVKLGLGAIHTSEYCFIQNIDNPFIDSQILDLIYEKRSNVKYVSPVFKNKGGHPVLLNRGNMIRICNWSENSTNFKNVLNTMECVNVEMPDDRVLININSPEEYNKIKK
jgi:CTP:molybdopterin cytidylyltransferase MocA